MRRLALPALSLLLISSVATALTLQPDEDKLPGYAMTEAASAFLASLDDEQRAQAMMGFDSDARVDWHFIPKAERKGVQLRDMNAEQRAAAIDLMRASLSAGGFRKARRVMRLEAMLREMERDRDGGPVRDPQRYYISIFGDPREAGRWGLSIEGHHLSLNFVVDNGRVTSSSPSFFGANPATVMNEVEGGMEVGTRVLQNEEQLAFDLLNALTDEQRRTAVIDDTAPREIRAAGEAQPPRNDPVGIAFSELDTDQRRILTRLVRTYARHVPAEVAESRLESGMRGFHFAWAGSAEPGEGHYYRIQGPDVLIEFVNTQPDPAGNPANHIHCVWRDLRGDFAIPITGQP